MKSLGNKFMHLTNYSVNKKNAEYQPNADETACQGHKWYLGHVPVERRPEECRLLGFGAVQGDGGRRINIRPKDYTNTWPFRIGLFASKLISFLIQNMEEIQRKYLWASYPFFSSSFSS